MRIRSAVLSSLAMLPLLPTSGCGGRTGCEPPRERFEIDEPVSVAQIDAAVKADAEIASRSGAAPLEECRVVCDDSYRRTRRWQPIGVDSCTLTRPQGAAGSEAQGHITCSGTGIEFYCEGRRPLGHAEIDAGVGGDDLGRSLAAMAYLEAASVLAFEELAAWLSVQRAPSELVERCRAAADDERHHARWLTRLAGQRDATVRVPVPREASEASTLEVALHNAVEGCVHESFAALMAAVRAERAESPWLRRVFARIAADETCHGQLAWDLDAWLRERLAPGQVRMVERRQREALARLPARARALQSGMPESLGRLDAEQAERLASCFAARLVA
jgi:rubrerythrin